MHFSKFAYENYFVSVNSFVKLVSHLLESGRQFVFGRQRMKLGCNENPMLSDCMYNELKLQVAKVKMIKTRGQHDNKTLIDIADTISQETKERIGTAFSLLSYCSLVEGFLRNRFLLDLQQELLISILNPERKKAKKQSWKVYYK